MSAKPTECAYLSVIDHKKVGYHTEVCQNNKSTFVRMFDFHIQNLQYINYLIGNSVFLPTQSINFSI